VTTAEPAAVARGLGPRQGGGASAGISRIADTIRTVNAAGSLALVGWQTVGYPDKTAARRLVPELIAGGFDLIELGVPFSDPQADGATIQRASEAALANGTTLRDCLQSVRDLRADGVTAPLIFMSYYNPVLAMGVERFADAAAEAGLDGMIVPDLPPEEADELLAALDPAGIDLIFLVAPTSTEERLAAVGARARGFVYCVSLTGVTGARAHLSTTLPEYLVRVRRHTTLPLVVGFGVSRPEHVELLRGQADGAVVASAIIDLMARTPVDQHPQALHAYAASLRSAAGPR
jgi:tryptophan synthase alpha chain